VKKIFRWLLSNLLLILVIISVIYSYMFWGNLTGKNTPVGKAVAYLSNEFDGVGQFVEGVKNKQARLSGTLSNEQQDQTLGIQSQGAQSQPELQLDKQLDEQAVTEIDAAMSDVDTTNVVATSENELGVEKQVATNGQQLSQENVQEKDVQENASIEKTDDVAQKAQSELEQEKLEQENSEGVSSEAASSEQVNSKLVVAEQTDESQLGELQPVEQQPVSISYSHNNMHVQQNSDGELEVQPQSLTTQIENVATQKIEGAQESGQLSTTTTKESLSKNDFVSTEIASQLESIDDSGDKSGINGNGGWEQELSAERNSDIAPESMSIPETWIIARKSFYQKKYDLSEKSYRSVIAGTKDNFDAYGELGNVYFNQGKDTQAAEAYLQAATILLVKGDIQRAQSLLQVLQQLDAAKAKQLQRLLGQPLS